MKKHKGRKKLTVVGPHLGAKHKTKHHKESKAMRKKAARKHA
jgi:hypothetical protein